MTSEEMTKKLEETKGQFGFFSDGEVIIMQMPVRQVFEKGSSGMAMLLGHFEIFKQMAVQCVQEMAQEKQVSKIIVPQGGIPTKLEVR